MSAKEPSPAEPTSTDPTNWVCPFCGLLCDDLTPAEALAGGDALCGASRKQLRDTIKERNVSPRVDGEDVPLEHAVKVAARLLRASRAPWFQGLETDLAGVRATLNLAERCRGVVSHKEEPTLNAALRVIQDRGWTATTLSEVRNRAESLVVFGPDPSKPFPRFFERISSDGEPMCIEAGRPRHLFSVGHRAEGVVLPTRSGWQPRTVRASARNLDASAHLLLQALTNPDSLARASKGERAFVELATALRNSRYTVFVWTPAALRDLQAPDLFVETIAKCVEALNESTRAAVLPLGGNNGSQSAVNASTWQTGIPLPVSFIDGSPGFAPSLESLSSLSTCSVWIGGLGNTRFVPAPDCSSVALVRSDLVARCSADVVIPVGTPGIDHGGAQARCDSVVTLRLSPLRDSQLPSTAETLNQILRILG